MYFLDYLNESPNFFIFQQKANKTNFGGVLFLLYIIIMILISLAYILDYELNEKYIYESFRFYNYTTDNEELNKDEKLNPFFNVTISIYGNGDFVVYDTHNNKFIESTEIDYNYHSIYYIRSQASDINFFIYYKCGDDKNCSSFKDFIEFHSEVGDSLSGYVIYNYPGYKLYHSEDPPMKIDMDWFQELFFIKNNTGIEKMTYEWEVTKYKDQQSMFDSLTGNKREYIGGYVKNDKKPILDIEKYKIINYYEKGFYLPLFHIKFENNHKEYLYYKRKKIEFLSVIANIGALFSTVKFFFSLFFSFYSKNFDNYKIVCKILNFEQNLHQGMELSLEVKSSLSSKKDEDKNTNFDDANNLGPLFVKMSENNELNAQDYDLNNDIDDADEESSIVVNKLPFYEFYLNNIYSKFCWKMKNQEIINKTNEIIHKYISIDTLLYNQIKLENLFKDYKWNNPLLNSIKNNEMIMKLKNS